MAQILPRFDPGAEIGRGFGQGVGQGVEQVVDRQRLIGGLEALKSLEFDNMSTGDVVRTLSKSFVGIPGGMQVLETLLPRILAERKGRGQAEIYKEGGGVPPGGQPQPGSQPQPQPHDGMQPQPQGGDIQPQGGVSSQRPQTSLAARPQQQDSIIQQAKHPELTLNGLIYQPPSMQEVGRKRQELASQGVVGAEQDAAMRAWEDTRKSSFNAAKETQEIKERAFEGQRRLSETQDNLVKQATAKQLGISESEVDPYFTDKYRDIFQKNKQESLDAGKNLSDSQLETMSNREFKKINESFASGEKLFRPEYISGDKTRRTENNKNWAQQHLKNFGDTKEDRDKLVSLFMKNGYSRTEADSFVKPFSPELNNVIRSLEKAPQITKTEYMKPATPQETERSQVKKTAYLDNLSNKIAKNFKDKDSILLLRDKLVRDKNLSEDDFMQVLRLTQDKMQQDNRFFTPEQVEELPDLQKQVTPSLFEMLFEGGLDLKRWLQIGAK